MSEKFEPYKVQCPTCKDIIYSTYPGEWVSCSCFRNEEGNKGIYIDQTTYHTRIGGRYLEVLDNDNA